MLPISTQARFFLYSEAVDMRKSFDGLHGLVIDSLNMNPLSGDVYIFINRRRNRIKLSYESLIMLLEGIDLLSVKRRKRYRKTV